MRALPYVPAECDESGALFSLENALICRKGGLVLQGHNEVRGAIGGQAAMTLSQVKWEPIIKDAYEESNSPVLIADLTVREVWQPLAMTLFDVSLTDTDTQSYSNHFPRRTNGCQKGEERKVYEC